MTMSRFPGIAVRAIGAVAAGMLSIGAMSAFAAAPSASPTPTSSATDTTTSTDRHSDRRAIGRAVLDSEADVLGIQTEALVRDIKHGLTVAELARAEGLTKSRFTTRLVIRLTLHLDTLVDHHVISPQQAETALRWVASGHIPFWNGGQRVE
jgi:hypothetical protein